MSRWQKRPLLVEAFQYNFKSGTPWPEWAKDAVLQGILAPFGDNGCRIRTDKGLMFAFPGDWIIRGTHGDLYSCEDDIFRTVYEEVLD